MGYFKEIEIGFIKIIVRPPLPIPGVAKKVRLRHFLCSITMFMNSMVFILKKNKQDEHFLKMKF